MKRISVVVDDYLLSELNKRAGEQHKMFSEMVRDILRNELYVSAPEKTPDVIPVTPPRVIQIIHPNTPKRIPKKTPKSAPKVAPRATPKSAPKITPKCEGVECEYDYSNQHLDGTPHEHL